MHLLGWFKKSRKSSSLADKLFERIMDFWLADLKFEQYYLKEHLAKTLNGLGFKVKKPKFLRCKDGIFFCYKVAKEQAIKAFKEQRFEDAAKYTGEALALLERILKIVNRTKKGGCLAC